MNLDSCKFEIIERGFPEVRPIIVEVSYKKLKEAYFESDRSSRQKYELDVDVSLRHAPRKVIMGGMSHEIAHIVRDLRFNSLFLTLERALCNIKWYETWDERQTDILVVKRGLGKELLAFLQYADKRRENYTIQDGLTVRELKQMLKKDK